MIDSDLTLVSAVENSPEISTALLSSPETDLVFSEAEKTQRVKTPQTPSAQPALPATAQVEIIQTVQAEIAQTEAARTEAAQTDATRTKIDQAVVVQAYFGGEKNPSALPEFLLLAKSAQVHVCHIITANRTAPQAKYFIGDGKAQEITDAVQTHQANVVLINHALSPAQIRNLEDRCQCRVIDRTALILDIFAQRARSHEGKLQVELAQLKYLSTRLIRRKTGLDQQKGAVGLRGPGETRLETDRRLIKVRLNQLQSRLNHVAKQRNQNRRSRQKANVPTVSLVGYTNAGKSTLFNRLTQASVYAADQLFATLDPTLRRLQIDGIGDCVLADTVGFIRQLPHDLISAFKSTLQESIEANLLLHVIDVADENLAENRQSVDDVLQDIGAGDVPTLLVYNKIDRLEASPPHIEYDAEQRPVAVYLSAQQDSGLDLLLTAVRQRLTNQTVRHRLELHATQGRLRHALYELHAVKRETLTEQGNMRLDIELDAVQWHKLQKHFPDLTA